MTVEPSASPMPALNKYVFRFADPDPVKMRFRYGGPIATEHDTGNKPLRPEGYELFLDHMWFPVGADLQTRFTVDAKIDGDRTRDAKGQRGSESVATGGVRHNNQIKQTTL